MRHLASVAILCALFAAAPALAQQGPPPGAPPPGAPPDGPPPAMQQQMDAARTTAHTNAMNALAPDHQTAITAIVGQVQAGQITDLRDAAKKIDAILTPKESAAVLAARDKMMSDMRASAPPGDGPPGDGPPPNSGGPGFGPPGGRGGGPPGGRRGGRGGMRNDAGVALLMLSLDRDQMRSLFMHGRDER
jgi:hypothetical protein